MTHAPGTPGAEQRGAWAQVMRGRGEMLLRRCRYGLHRAGAGYVERMTRGRIQTAGRAAGATGCTVFGGRSSWRGPLFMDPSQRIGMPTGKMPGPALTGS
ncbi:hypothetical protein ADK52_08225 [Streptomyces sp. WM6372]|nr:hypothetical protein ADK52_08225 [Streptomyces sp. WM6372]